MTRKFCNFLTSQTRKKYFPKHFQKDNQTQEKKIVFPKSTLKNFPNKKQLCQNNNNNKVLVPNFLGLAMDPQKISQGQLYVFFFDILFYLKSYFLLCRNKWNLNFILPLTNPW